MKEDPIVVITRWSWKPIHQKFVMRIVDIRGGSIPENVRQKLIQSSPPDLDAESDFFQLAKRIAEYLAPNISVPPPIDLGGATQITGVITQIEYFESRTSENPNQNSINCYVEYSNGIKTEAGKTFLLGELPEFIQALILEIHRDVNAKVRKWFWEQYGQGEINPEKWKAEKLEVFISYRSTSGSVIADQLFDALGSFENSSTFLPRIDKVDLQAGNWLDQLMKMIDRSRVFIPILTTDYLDGPISRPELDQALRQALAKPGKRIVPILIEGSPKDYENHFIGGFQIIVAKEGITEDMVKKIAYMCLGISRNPYE